MKLYFENPAGNRRIIAFPNSAEEAAKEIHKFCEARNFKIHYTRTWKDDRGNTVYDVGSWSEFFILEE